MIARIAAAFFMDSGPCDQRKRWAQLVGSMVRYPHATRGSESLMTMRYLDGNEAAFGDVIAIDTTHRGKVICCIDASPNSPNFDQWGYLGVGIMVDTDFGGLVHYTREAIDNLALTSIVPALKTREASISFWDRLL